MTLGLAAAPGLRFGSLAARDVDLSLLTSN